MENIDDFMQRKFDSDDPAERFPFREEYWEQAQALIEADEQKRRKRRRFLFWWFSGMLLLGTGALYFWPNRNVPAENPISSHTTNTAPVVSSPTQPAGTQTRTTGASVSGQATEQAISSASAPESGEEQSARTEKAYSASGVNPRGVTGNDSPGSRNNQKPAPGQSNTSTQRTAGVLPGSTAQNIQNLNSAVRPADSDDPKDVPQNSESAVPNDPRPPAVATTPAAAAVQAPDRMTLIKVLELPFLPAIRRKPVLLLKKTPPNVVEEIKPVQDRRGRWVIGASASTWDAGWGYTFGVARKYPLNEHWSFSAGLHGRYVPLAATVSSGPDTSNNVTVQYRYSFGVERTESRRTAKSSFSLEVPVAAHWQHGRFGLAAGVSPGLLSSVQDKVVETRETTLGGLKTVGQTTQQGDKTEFRTGYLSTFASAEWRVLPGLGLAVQGNYRPGSMLKPAENVVPQKDFWYLDLGLRWQF